MTIDRRGFLRAGAAAGAFLITRPFSGLARAFGGGLQLSGASRTSRLFPSGTFVVHSDLHNHTTMSDGAEVGELAYARMRAAGLDVASITDHAVFGKFGVGLVCREDPSNSNPCTDYAGMNEDSWAKGKLLADAAHEDHEFVAMRGFEWTTGELGHLNVWFTENWIDALSVGSLASPTALPVLFESIPEPGPTLAGPIRQVTSNLPNTATIDGFYEWLAADPARPLLGGGADGIAGFNHPNEYGNFEAFKFFPSAVERVVSCEAINGRRDFLFWPGPDPINACLNAGWRVGMLGVSDEHFVHGSTENGAYKGRGGLWVNELTRAGVREALTARRFFASLEPGLRLDASANGVRMGQTVPHTSGPVEFKIDIDRGADWVGKELSVQVLRPGSNASAIAHSATITVPSDLEPVVSFTIPVDIADGGWALLRVSDPERAPDPRAPDHYQGFGATVAYTSPFWFASPLS